MVDHHKSSYLMVFDRDYSLEYINHCHPEHIGTLFNHSSKESQCETYKLHEMFNSAYFKENLATLVMELVDRQETHYHSEQQDVRIKINYDRQTRMSSVLLRIKPVKNKLIDQSWNVKFVLQPINGGSELTATDGKTPCSTPRANEMLKRYKLEKQKAIRLDDGRSPIERHDSLYVKTSDNLFVSRQDSPISSNIRSKGGNPHKSQDKVIKPILVNSRTINYEGSLL